MLSRRSLIAATVASCSFLSMTTLPAMGDAATPSGATASGTPSTPDALQRLLDRYAGQGNLPGIIVSVSSPSAGLDWQAASGLADVATSTPMRSNAPFRIASNTKTYTAAAILRLVEEQQLALEATLDTLLPQAYLDLLGSGGYDSDQITVAMLAHHTSGLWDYAQSDAYLGQVFSDPSHQWSRIEQVRFAMENGTPEGAPGERFVYSDTGYILLGQIIEELTGLPLAGSFRSLLRFEELGLGATWLEGAERMPSGLDPMVHSYLGTDDGMVIDPTADLFGGGGLVANATDLGRFYEALFAGRVFAQAATLETMLHEVAISGKSHVGMGIFRQEIAGYSLYQHTGFWGSAAMVLPERDLTVTFFANQVQVDPEVDLDVFVTDLLDLAVAATA